MVFVVFNGFRASQLKGETAKEVQPSVKFSLAPNGAIQYLTCKILNIFSKIGILIRYQSCITSEATNRIVLVYRRIYQCFIGVCRWLSQMSFKRKLFPKPPWEDWVDCSHKANSFVETMVTFWNTTPQQRYLQVHAGKIELVAIAVYTNSTF